MKHGIFPFALGVAFARSGFLSRSYPVWRRGGWSGHFILFGGNQAGFHLVYRLAFSVIRAFTIFLTSAVGSGLSAEKRIVPLVVGKPFSRDWSVSTIAELMG